MKRVTYRLPAYLLIIMNLLGFSLLYMANDYQASVFYVGIGVLALFLLIYSVLVICRMGDKFLVLIASMLMTMGILMLCRLDIVMGARQIVWIGVGSIVFFLSYIVYYKIRFWDKLWFCYAAAGVMLFVMTLVFGMTVNGSRNWISLGIIAFQPSETIKILYVMFLACHYSGSWNRPFLRLTPMLMTGAVTYLYIIFLVLQRDWGTILVVFSIFIFMIYVYEKKPWFLFGNVAAALVVAFFGYKFLYHIQVRVGVWLDPWTDISNKGYQIAQSLFAISSGGYFGRGLGNGAPDYIPEAHTDFIFSAICEEMGVFGGAAIIILYFLFSYRCFKIALNTENLYNKAVALGLTLMFSLQTFIIIGGVIKFIPLTGITLPFVSYGGTSIVVSFASMGIIQAISAIEDRKGAVRIER
ncbi:MAG: FtsW/RodA/SpoVE family cell cycle protein [Ruminococcaceae bacterium]|nr:FtsW/RodA/SpoVE family cell cycle protein [Oscillospiraceae bacterium]